MAICTSAPAAIAKHRRLGGLTVGNGFSHNSGGWRCQQVWCLGGLSPQLADGAFLLCPHAAFPLCTCVGRECTGGFLLLIRTPRLLDWSFTLWPHLTLTMSFKALSPNTVPLELWASKFEFVENAIQAMIAFFEINLNFYINWFISHEKQVCVPTYEWSSWFATKSVRCIIVFSCC